MSLDQNARRKQNIKKDNSSFERAEPNNWEWPWRIKILFRKKLRADWSQGVHAIFRCKIFSYSLLSTNIKSKIHRNIILPFVLCGCETWSFILREGRRLRVFENGVLRRIFGSKRDEVTGEWRKLHNTELNDLYCSPNIIRVIKSRRMW